MQLLTDKLRTQLPPLYAQGNTPDAMIYAKFSPPRPFRQYSGDTYVKVIWENEYNLVVISVDRGIEVINCLKKADITKSPDPRTLVHQKLK